MNLQTINKNTWINMIAAGANFLARQKEAINKLNVFPVPDGDTGTNMNLSMSSGVKEMEKLSNHTLQEYIHAFTRGLLMGARGNSGVILSQLFRGFSEKITEKDEINVNDFVHALSEGVHIAYSSVTNPVEGTILTVAKDMAKIAQSKVNDSAEFISLMQSIVEEGKQSLARTPSLLPILKEVGVVDSGGKGLVVIYEGFLAALQGKEIERVEEDDFEQLIEHKHEAAVQSFVNIDSIEYGYCTEFFIQLTETNHFDESHFRTMLTEYGDSLLVASDAQLVKVHIHTEQPGEVLSLAQQYGALENIDIENMRTQYENIVNAEDHHEHKSNGKYAIITVVQGKGLQKVFRSIGASAIIDGGQTMNPSTEDFIQIIEKQQADHIIVLPNNKNILLAANQAVQLTEKNVTVVPTVTIPQGIQALFEFDKQTDIDDNVMAMNEVIDNVKTGLITYATRDTTLNNLVVKKSDFIGLDDDTIKVVEKTSIEAAKSLINEIVTDDDEIITLFTGQDVPVAEREALQSFIEQSYSDCEVEIYEGNQPIYFYILMIE